MTDENTESQKSSNLHEVTMLQSYRAAPESWGCLTQRPQLCSSLPWQKARLKTENHKQEWHMD